MTDFTQPVVTSAINAADHLVGFQGDFTFDETVVTFDPDAPVSAAGLTGGNCNSDRVGNVLPGAGRRSGRCAYWASSNDASHRLSGSGTLFNLNMTRVSSTPGASTALTWPYPDDFVFIDANLNNHAPGSTPPGSITIQRQAINISGTVIYCSNPSLNPVPNVTLTLTGTSVGLNLVRRLG